MSAVGGRMRTAREYYGFSQNGFGDTLSVDQSYLSQIERGKWLPSENLLAEMYRIYGINAEWILKGTGAMIDGAATVKIPELNKSNKSIGERMRAARQHYGLSQVKFSQGLFINVTWLCHIESGKRIPSENLLTKMHRTYKINAEWILKGTGKMIDGEPADVSSEPLLRRIGGLTDRTILKTIITTIEDCAITFNKQLSPKTKANLVVNFYQYFCGTGGNVNINDKEVKMHIVQSFDVIVHMLGQQG